MQCCSKFYPPMGHGLIDYLPDAEACPVPSLLPHGSRFAEVFPLIK